jgi:hypothetical protein
MASATSKYWFKCSMVSMVFYILKAEIVFKPLNIVNTTLALMWIF